MTNSSPSTSSLRNVDLQPPSLGRDASSSDAVSAAGAERMHYTTRIPCPTASAPVPHRERDYSPQPPLSPQASGTDRTLPTPVTPHSTGGATRPTLNDGSRDGGVHASQTRPRRSFGGAGAYDAFHRSRQSTAHYASYVAATESGEVGLQQQPPLLLRPGFARVESRTKPGQTVIAPVTTPPAVSLSLTGALPSRALLRATDTVPTGRTGGYLFSTSARLVQETPSVHPEPPPCPTRNVAPSPDVVPCTTTRPCSAPTTINTAPVPPPCQDAVCKPRLGQLLHVTSAAPPPVLQARPATRTSHHFTVEYDTAESRSAMASPGVNTPLSCCSADLDPSTPAVQRVGRTTSDAATPSAELALGAESVGSSVLTLSTTTRRAKRRPASLFVSQSLPTHMDRSEASSFVSPATTHAATVVVTTGQEVTTRRTTPHTITSTLQPCGGERGSLSLTSIPTTGLTDTVGTATHHGATRDDSHTSPDLANRPNHTSHVCRPLPTDPSHRHAAPLSQDNKTAAVLSNPTPRASTHAVPPTPDVCHGTGSAGELALSHATTARHVRVRHASPSLHRPPLVRLTHDGKTLIAGDFRVCEDGCLTVRNFLLLNPHHTEDEVGSGQLLRAGTSLEGVTRNEREDAHEDPCASPRHGPAATALVPDLLLRSPTSLAVTPASTALTPGLLLCPCTSPGVLAMEEQDVEYGMTTTAAPYTPALTALTPARVRGRGTWHENASFTLQSTSMNMPYSPITYSMDSLHYPETMAPGRGGTQTRRLLQARRELLTPCLAAARGSFASLAAHEEQGPARLSSGVQSTPPLAATGAVRNAPAMTPILAAPSCPAPPTSTNPRLFRRSSSTGVPPQSPMSTLPAALAASSQRGRHVSLPPPARLTCRSDPAPPATPPSQPMPSETGTGSLLPYVDVELEQQRQEQLLAEAPTAVRVSHPGPASQIVVRHRDLDLRVAVGEGASACVYLALHRPTGRRLAVKRVSLEPLCLDAHRKLGRPSSLFARACDGARVWQLRYIIVRELQVLHLGYRSPFMVKVYNAFYLPDLAALDIVMEFMHYGSIDTLAKCLQRHARRTGVTSDHSVPGSPMARLALDALATRPTSPSLNASTSSDTDDAVELHGVREEPYGVCERVVAVVGEQLLCGVRDMHARGFIHRDIKPGNVLVNEHAVVKLSDFGLSQRCAEVPVRGTTPSQRVCASTHPVASSRVRRPSRDAASCANMQLASSSSSSSSCVALSDVSLVASTSDEEDAEDLHCSGTLKYMSPERLRGEPHGKPSDIWAVGVTLSEFALGAYPYDLRDVTDFFDCLHRMEQPIDLARFNARRVTALSAVFQDFVRLATLAVPSQRPTAHELLEHPFFKQWSTPFDLKSYLAARVPAPGSAPLSSPRD